MKYVAYYRVSTEEQGTSGLGLKAQATSVLNYISQVGELVGEFQDIESGASESRQGMLAAIEACKINKAVLVVKEMSRISRGGFKYRQLMEDSKVDFIECNSPHDPEFVKDIKFSLAKDERKKIRQRTKDALGEIKLKIERGETHVSKAGNIVTALGNPDNLSDKSRAISIAVRKDKAMNDQNNVRAGAFIIALADSNNFKQITQKLNAAGFKTSRGNDFSEMQAKRLYDRYK
jgi:DNA invertase Pin-like site-specific DNA recombinase